MEAVAFYNDFTG